MSEQTLYRAVKATRERMWKWGGKTIVIGIKKDATEPYHVSLEGYDNITWCLPMEDIYFLERIIDEDLVSAKMEHTAEKNFTLVPSPDPPLTGIEERADDLFPFVQAKGHGQTVKDANEQSRSKAIQLATEVAALLQARITELEARVKELTKIDTSWKPGTIPYET